jgi:protoheme IX farnesyltransferase
MTGIAVSHRPRLGVVVGAYIALMKPRVIELLLVTTLPAMVLAERGLPSLRLVVFTLLGGTLAAGSANALNCYLDRDIDAIMKRTAMRPLTRTAGDLTVSPRSAVVFGLVLGVVAVSLLWVTTNALAALLALTAIVIYVLGYTIGLKRRTPSNIVWGGAAGCMPVLIGQAAVTGTLTWASGVLFLVIFWWTPPHFWALAVRFRDEYEAAGVPMLPVVADVKVVARRIVGYSWAMVGASLALIYVGKLGAIYSVAAIATGAVFLREAYLVRGRARAAEDLKPMRLFHWSITYLSLLSLAIVVDVMLPIGR